MRLASWAWTNRSEKLGKLRAGQAPAFINDQAGARAKERTMADWQAPPFVLAKALHVRSPPVLLLLARSFE